MPNEGAARQTICKILRKAGKHPVPIENTLAKGTADVEYVDGWIELKALDEWPRRGLSLVRVDKYTKEQRQFARLRHRAGGRIFFLLKIDNTQEWLLFDGITAAEKVGTLTCAGLHDIAIGYWQRSVDPEEFLSLLTGEPIARSTR